MSVPQITALTQSYMLHIHLTHNYFTGSFMECRYNPDWTVAKVKDQIYLRCGTEAAYQQLTLKDEAGKDLAQLSDDNRTIGSYGAKDGHTIHCNDTNPNSLAAGGGLENVALVEKYEMSEETYDARANSYRAWKKKLIETEPDHPFLQKIRGRIENKTGEEEAKAIHVDDRVEVVGGRRGTVRFVGVVPQLRSGWWVGVEYDEPVGKHDGAVQGKRYFTAPASCGGFARPDKVTVGDFPPCDEDFASEDEL